MTQRVALLFLLVDLVEKRLALFQVVLAALLELKKLALIEESLLLAVFLQRLKVFLQLLDLLHLRERKLLKLNGLLVNELLQRLAFFVSVRSLAFKLHRKVRHTYSRQYLVVLMLKSSVIVLHRKKLRTHVFRCRALNSQLLKLQRDFK